MAPVRVEDGVYRPAGELGAIAVPDTLRSLIAARLDALDPADRSTVQDASVLGQTVTLRALSAVSGHDELDLASRMRVLVRQELFAVQADPSSPERGQYAFVQSLIREVAYGTLGRRERRARHLAAARHFEALGDDELAGVLATHYLAAYAASSPGEEATAVGAQARLALRSAGDRAGALGAHDQAIAFYLQAAEVTSAPADLATLHLRAARAATGAGRHDEAERVARMAIDDARVTGDVALSAVAVAELGSVMLYANKPVEASTTLRDALEQLPSDAPDDARARLLCTLSRAYMRIDEHAAAIATADLALPIAERLGLEGVLADALNNKAAALGSVGRHREAIALMGLAIEVAHVAGLVSEEIRARNNLAGISWALSPARTYQLVAETIPLVRRIGDRSQLAWLLGIACGAAWQTATDWDGMVALTREAIATSGSLTDRALAWSGLAVILVCRGEPVDDGLAVMIEAARESSETLLTSSADALQGDLAFMRGDLPEALRHYVRAAGHETMAGAYLPLAIRAAVWAGDVAGARAAAAALDADVNATTPLALAHRAVASAGLAALDGRPDDAVAPYREAIRRYLDVGADLEAALATIDLLRVADAYSPEARRLAEEARATLERVDARAWLERLDAALAAGQEGPTGLKTSARS